MALTYHPSSPIEEDGETAEDSDLGFRPSQLTEFSESSEDDSSTVAGDGGAADLYPLEQTQPPPPTQPVDWQPVYNATRTRTLRKEDTWMSIDGKSVSASRIVLA